MVNNRGFILHKVAYKKGRKHDYDIYKNNHPVISKEAVNVVDLGYLDIENPFPDQLFDLSCKKEEKSRTIERRKRIQQKSF